jgi:hypothetical protein
LCSFVPGEYDEWLVEPPRDWLLIVAGEGWSWFGPERSMSVSSMKVKPAGVKS